MQYDVVVWSTRRRWTPLKHAAREVNGLWVSLCGTFDQRHWTRYIPHAVGSLWLHDVTCPQCCRLIRSAGRQTQTVARP